MKYYGNYLGICISRMDPEKRGRVKIFIPEIYPSLYEKWNEDGRNVTINCVGDNVTNSITSEFREHLEKMLPYAESASPVFGSSAPGFFNNATGNYVQTSEPGAQSLTGNPDVNASSPASAPLAQPGAGVKPSNAMNGRLDKNNPQQLVPLGDYVSGLAPSQRYLNPFVEPKFKELCLAYQAETGKKMILSDCYRSYDEQVACVKEKGLYPSGLCAAPGRSNHGLGTAVDCGGPNKREQEIWLFKNGGKYGFSTIAKGGPGSREAWHWEIKPANLPPEAFAYTLSNTTTQKNTQANTAEVKPKE